MLIGMKTEDRKHKRLACAPKQKEGFLVSARIYWKEVIGGVKLYCKMKSTSETPVSARLQRVLFQSSMNSIFFVMSEKYKFTDLLLWILFQNKGYLKVELIE